MLPLASCYLRKEKAKKMNSARHSNPHSHPKKTAQTEESPNDVTSLIPGILAALNAKAADIYASGATLVTGGNANSAIVTLTLSNELLLDVLENVREALVANMQDVINDTVEAILRKSFGTGGGAQ
jgi:hypothetical protein